MSECWIEKLFHPDFYDSEWLLERFEKFMLRKIVLDAAAHQQKNRHAPILNPRVVYRELGRDSIDSLVLLHEEKETVDRYMKLVCDPKIVALNAEPMTKLSLQRGVIGDLMQMVRVLRKEDPELSKNVLQLVECVHLTYICKREYETNCKPEHKWMVEYVSKLTEEICMNRADFETAFANGGCQMQTLLDKATAIVTSSGIAKPQRVTVWHKNLGRRGQLWLENTPMQMEYDAVSLEKASRMQIQKIPTT